jgi:hypothetical protein
MNIQSSKRGKMQNFFSIYKTNHMTAKAALAKALLEGQVLNIKNCFTMIGLTNCPREISRMIEKPFGVVVSRTPRKGKSRYGKEVTWFDYRLNRTEYNKEGIKKMKSYVNKHQN